MKIKKKILVTHWDKNIDPEIFKIKGKSQKSLIIDFYRNSKSIDHVLDDDDDEFLNDIANGELTKKELKSKCPYETIDELMEALNSMSEFYFRYK